jgi:molybdopterin-biosynthesis enzyme MoeA-like protein
VKFCLTIIGDEILSGKRQDRHFAHARDVLRARGLALAQVTYVGDDRARIAATLRRSFAAGEVVLCCGGIGSTPDDHTRQAAAAALDVPLQFHPEAEALIAQRMRELKLELTPERRRMGEFPRGAALIPNPFNGIPGFSIREHYFMPGFPEMAWPMMEWVLDTHYAQHFHAHALAERGFTLRGIGEGEITPLLEEIEARFPGVRTYSLPRVRADRRDYGDIDVGVKGAARELDAPFELLRSGVLKLGATILPDA